MPSCNYVSLMGNITRDIELKYTPKGTAIADIGLAINRVWTDDQGRKQEDVTFVDVTLWGRTAEIVGQYCKKGHPLFVQGHLQLDTWDDKQTGQKRSKLKVTGDSIQLLGSKEDGEKKERPAQQRPSRPATQQRPKDPDLDPPEDDTPF